MIDCIWIMGNVGSSFIKARLRISFTLLVPFEKYVMQEKKVKSAQVQMFQSTWTFLKQRKRQEGCTCVPLYNI